MDNNEVSWTSKLSSDNDAMTIPIPNGATYSTTEIVPELVNAYSYGQSYVGSNTVSCGTYGGITTVPNNEKEASEYDYFSYICQNGKNRSSEEYAVIREKNKEKIIVTHAFCERGFARVKRFSDESWDWHIIACGRIEQVQHWLINGTEYVKLLISDTTPSYIVREAEWTNVFEVSELEKDKFVEELLSRYFKPVDSRVYESAALKDFRARIKENIHEFPLEVAGTESGWFEFGNKRIYYDGSNFPKKEHVLGLLRRSSSKTNISAEEILGGICEELAVYDLGRRISFLIGYGLITWFSDVCSINWNKCPGIMLLGKENVCRRYVDACLKMYARANGSDIVELLDIDKRTLTEYVDVLKDDAFVLNANELTAGNLKFAKAIIAGRSISNHRVNVPIVILQNVPKNEIAYSDYVTVDLNGFNVSERLCFYMQELKARLLSIFEAEPVTGESCTYRTMSYEEAIKIVLPSIKKCLLTAGAPMTVLDKFFGYLEQGMMMYYQFCGNEQDTLVYMLKQRFEQIMSTGEITVTGDIVKGVSHDPKYSLIVKDNAVFIPSKYLEIGIFPKLGIDRGEFRRVRDALIANGLLDIYGDKKGYTRKITIGETRVHTYKFAKSLFSNLENTIC